MAGRPFQLGEMRKEWLTVGQSLSDKREGREMPRLFLALELLQ